jgi:hypothetical protein
MMRILDADCWAWPVASACTTARPGAAARASSTDEDQTKVIHKDVDHGALLLDSSH